MKFYLITAWNSMHNGSQHPAHDILLQAPAAMAEGIDRYLIGGNYYCTDFSTGMKSCSKEQRKELAALKFEGDLLDMELKEGVARIMDWTLPNTSILGVQEAPEISEALFFRD